MKGKFIVMAEKHNQAVALEVKDLYKRFVKPDATEDQVLRVARGAAVVGGAGGVLLAVVLPSVVDALQIFYSLLGVILFVPVVAGIHSRRPGVAEALAGAGAGVLALLVSEFGTGEPRWAWLTPSAYGMTWAAVAFGTLFVFRTIHQRVGRSG